jgi:hypothetical protein
MRFRGSLSLALALGAAGLAGGQGQPVPPPQVTGGGSGGFSKVIDGVVHSFTITTQNTPLPMRIAFTGAPYSGDQIEVVVQRLADGSELTQRKYVGREYRDSAGRTRTEHFALSDDPNSNPAPSFVDIADPVANVQYRLETRNKIARRWDMAKIPGPENAVFAPVGISHGEGLPDAPPPRTMSASARPAAPTGPPPTPPPGAIRATGMSMERLGTRVIDGITTEGTRTSNSQPRGPMGETLATPIVSEQWTATDLRVTLFSKMSDPRLGETTRSWLHFSREEPPITLFQPPPDYRVVDEKVSVTINHRVSK